MEITTSYNITSWYQSFSPGNPQEYWPIDYPPTISYFMYLWGKVFEFILPESIVSLASWGYESPNHKILMRLTVLISDIILFHIPLYFVLNKLFQNVSRFNYNVVLFLVLVCPVLNLIDHGHFQYNCVMSGLYLWAVYFCYIDQICFAIIFFTLSVNFKQMALYYSLPFVVYVLGKLLKKTENKGVINRLFTIGFYVVLYGLCAAGFLLLIWSPWILTNTYDHVLKRIFPIWRGIFEDKVF